MQIFVPSIILPQYKNKQIQSKFCLITGFGLRFYGTPNIGRNRRKKRNRKQKRLRGKNRDRRVIIQFAQSMGF